MIFTIDGNVLLRWQPSLWAGPTMTEIAPAVRPSMFEDRISSLAAEFATVEAEATTGTTIEQTVKLRAERDRLAAQVAALRAELEDHGAHPWCGHPQNTGAASEAHDERILAPVMAFIRRRSPPGSPPPTGDIEVHLVWIIEAARQAEFEQTRERAASVAEQFYPPSNEAADISARQCAEQAAMAIRNMRREPEGA